MYLTESHIIVCYVYLVVLFFKQKTAYEMRISDWSSDVCSSDLNAVKDDSKRSIDIFSRHPRELAAARSVKPDVDHRLIVLLIKALLRIDELIAADHHLPLDGNIRYARRIGGIRQDFTAHRRATIRQIGGISGKIDQLEFQLGRFAQQGFQRFGILKARHLHNDPVRALTNNRGLLGAHFVDTLADDFGRHFHGAIHRRIKAGGCGRENNSAAVDDFDIPVALAAHARTLRQRADTLHRRINLAPVPDHERELVVTAGNITDGNLGIAPS